LALGGGVVGDLAGFAAATYMRGIRHVQVPTTMLAMVDSSVGGKTAIDLDTGKNLIGAFHQPSAVVIDPSVLCTLPRRELAGGLAEVIKHGVIRDAAFFAHLEDALDDLLKLDGDITREAVVRNCEIKAGVVAADEQESGLRAILNYGHTAGHAIEAVAGYGALSHGEAVSMGMVVAARVAAKLGMCPDDVGERQNALLKRAGLPVALGEIDVEAVLDVMRHDKKARGGKLLMILPTAIGEVEIVKGVDPAIVRAALEESRG
jgi:3-dehydroquinate synthase